MIFDEDFSEPKSVQNWTEKETRIATKNLLQDKACKNCKHNIYCLLKQNEYNTCYNYKESNINDILRIIRLSYPTTISSELTTVQPVSVPNNTIFYLKPIKNTPLYRTINKIKSIFIKRKEIY